MQKNCPTCGRTIEYCPMCGESIDIRIIRYGIYHDDRYWHRKCIEEYTGQERNKK